MIVRGNPKLSACEAFSEAATRYKIALRNPSMLVPMLTMHMLVGNFFLRRHAHGDHFQFKANVLARQRMVGIHVHRVALDLHAGGGHAVPEDGLVAVLN